MTTSEFNVEEYMKSIGRLDAQRKPIGRPALLTLKPGRPAKGKSAFHSIERVMFPAALIEPIFPADMPKEVYPLVVGPAFTWLSNTMPWGKIDAIRQSRIVYDERGSDLDLGDLMWSRMHAAYLLNEIAPDHEVTLHLLTSDRDSIHIPTGHLGIETARSSARHENHHSDELSYEWPCDEEASATAEASLSTLLRDEDEIDFIFDPRDALSFDEMKPGRRLTAKAWHTELLPLSRQHFTFMTNAQIFIRDLAQRFCSAPGDTGDLLKVFKPAVAKAMVDQMKSGLQSRDIGHAVVIQNLFAFADSTPAQRMALFAELVTAEKPEEIRPTLGNDLVAGRYFGSHPRRMQTLDRAAALFGLLIGAGIVSLDAENRTLSLTEGGRNFIDMIGPPLHIREYQRGIVDQLGNHVDPSVIGPAAEAVLMEYFAALKAKIEDLGQPQKQPSEWR